jgi:hypothetical protein
MFPQPGFAVAPEIGFIAAQSGQADALAVLGDPERADLGFDS